MQKRGKKAISPLIATVLIIGFTIVLAAVVMQWGGALFKGIQKEAEITEEISTTCSSISNLDLTVLNHHPVKVRIDNNNDVNIKGLVVRQYSRKDIFVEKQEIPISPFGSSKVTFSAVPVFVDKIGIFPQIRLENEKLATCDHEFTKNMPPLETSAMIVEGTWNGVGSINLAVLGGEKTITFIYDPEQSGNDISGKFSLTMDTITLDAYMDGKVYGNKVLTTFNPGGLGTINLIGNFEGTVVGDAITDGIMVVSIYDLTKGGELVESGAGTFTATKVG